jgi:acetolactate synthase-1/2/3 large subunit
MVQSTTREIDGQILLASSPGDHELGGGLFAFDGTALQRIDGLSSTGLYLADGHFLRLLRATDDVNPIAELLIYDARGVKNYYRVDGAGDAHDILWDGAHYVIVSSHTNSIFWVTPSGETGRVWRAPGEDDSWHLNCLLHKDGELFVCAFGRFQRHREWNEKRSNQAGLLFNLRTGEDVVTGLEQPHHPRFIDGAWVMCESASRQLVRVDARTGTRQCVQLAGFTRGIAVTDDYLFVGESARRDGPQQSQLSNIAVVGRNNWQVLDRIPLPAREIYDLVLAPPALVDGVRRGFNTNPLRMAEQNQHAMFLQAGIEPVRLWATADPLPRDGFKARISANVPQRFVVGTAIEVPCIVENLSGAFYVTAPPYPVQLGYKWLDSSTGKWVEERSWLRARLPKSLAPGERVSCTIRVVAPSQVGRFILRFALVQELVAWFDDVDPANALSSVVDVTSVDDVHPPSPSGERHVDTNESLSARGRES